MISIGKPVISVLLGVAIGLHATMVSAAAPLPQDLYAGMHWRMIGPFLGGRVEAVAGVPNDPETYYFGAVVGGVWKTTDGGGSWQPVFDKTPIASIGAIAVAPSDPNVIYVGTGEPDPRGDISFGNGIYKSTDAGKSWRYAGLADSRHIGRILVDPRNPDIVLVAALGHVHGPSSERGVFRTTDGGKTWQKVLYKNVDTGAIDLASDPHNPRIVFAALWQVRRVAWKLTDGGPGSGLYRSKDGGFTWQHLRGHGLPDGVLGRISVSVSGADGNRVYALINAKKGGLYRSDDGGDTWQLVNDDQHLRQRPWYYFRVYADPRNVGTVYVLNFKVNRSTDGGRKFTQIPTPHVDNHALWIDPQNPDRMIEGNDGGATITVNGGHSWSSETNQPTGQFYHVATDNRFPYYLYGAQQDRGAVAIASASRIGGIDEHDWYYVAGGESGYVLPDPRDHDIVYGGSYFGNLTRYNRHTGEVQDVTPWPENPEGSAASTVKYRFSWTSPLAFSPQDPDMLYAGSQYLLLSRNGGRSWQAISPDLTRNDKSKQQLSGGPITYDNVGAEYYDVIYTIAPSPVQQGVIWVGTDDGLVQLTRDGGKSWKNVTPKGLPEWATVSLIDASHFSAGTAYVAADAHKSDDMQPYIFRTHDFGRSWQKITTGIRAPAYAHVVREDPAQQGLLFAGTETGVYVSFDDGKAWHPLNLDMPVTSVRDLAIHDHDLIAATHGRGFWILDDIAPLEQLTEHMKDSPVVLFAPEVAIRTAVGQGNNKGAGRNPPHGAIIDYYLKSSPKGEIELHITDSHGKLIRRFSSAAKNRHDRLDAGPGGHRLVWNLRYAAPTPIAAFKPIFEAGEPITQEALPGKYAVELQVSGHTYRQPFTVMLDPRLKVTQQELASQSALMRKLHKAIAEDHQTFNQVYDLYRQLQSLHHRLDGRKEAKNILAAADSLASRTRELAERLFQYKARAPKWLFMNHPGQLNMRLVSLEGSVDSADAAPTEQQQAVYVKLRAELEQRLADCSHCNSISLQRSTP